MPTINSRKIIDEIIAANGRQYSDEPPVVRIVQYTNAWGNIAYGVVWEGMDDPYRYDRETEFVQNPKVIWTTL